MHIHASSPQGGAEAAGRDGCCLETPASQTLLTWYCRRSSCSSFSKAASLPTGTGARCGVLGRPAPAPAARPRGPARSCNHKFDAALCGCRCSSSLWRRVGSQQKACHVGIQMRAHATHVRWLKGVAMMQSL